MIQLEYNEYRIGDAIKMIIAKQDDDFAKLEMMLQDLASSLHAIDIGDQTEKAIDTFLKLIVTVIVVCYLSRSI